MDEVFDLAGEIVDCSAAVLGDLARNALEPLSLDRDLAEPFDQSGETSGRGVLSGGINGRIGLRSHTAGRADRLCVDICIALVVLLGGWFTGQWIYAPLDIDSLDPGDVLPTVAGGLLASYCASAVGQPMLAMVMFGLGLICWLILGSIMLARLFVRPILPTPPRYSVARWQAIGYRSAATYLAKSSTTVSAGCRTAIDVRRSGTWRP